MEMQLTLTPGEITVVVGLASNAQDWLRLVASSVMPGIYIGEDLPPWRDPLSVRFAAGVEFDVDRFGSDRVTLEDVEIQMAIERWQLREHLSKDWSELSKEQKLHFAFARVWLQKPALLVADEPLTGLDEATQQRVIQGLVDLAVSVRSPLAVLMSANESTLETVPGLWDGSWGCFRVIAADGVMS